MAGEPRPLEIDVAAAAEALEAAGGMPEVVPTEGTGYGPPRPVENKPEEADQTVPPEAPEPESTESDDFGKFTALPEEALSPELQQMQRSMQADYTRKMQEAAPWRKLGEELGVESPEDFREALELRNRLQDPRNWPTMQRELTEYMQSYGMEPAAAAAAADEQMAAIAPEEQIDYSQYEDTDMAPVLTQMQAMQARLDRFEANARQSEQKQQQDRQVQAVAAQLDKMETAIRAQNPTYGEQEIEMIYNIMGEDGNMFAARDKFESIIGSRVASYVTTKRGAQETTPSPVPGGGVIPSEEAEILDVDDAHRKAMAFVNELDRADAQG